MAAEGQGDVAAMALSALWEYFTTAPHADPEVAARIDLLAHYVRTCDRPGRLAIEILLGTIGLTYGQAEEWIRTRAALYAIQQCDANGLGEVKAEALAAALHHQRERFAVAKASLAGE